MKMLRALLITATILAFLPATNSHSAFLRNVPQTLTQPDGRIVECFATGDEFCNWLHDADGYLIVKDQKTGYFVYAAESHGKLSPTSLVAGVNEPDPAIVKRGAPDISESSYQSLKKPYACPQSMASDTSMWYKYTPSLGTLNNLVVLIRFADNHEYSVNLPTFSSFFSPTDTGPDAPYTESVRSWFALYSSHQCDVISTFYPKPDGLKMLSYQDAHPRGYYLPDSLDPLGYATGNEMRDREHLLLKNAIDAIKEQVPTELNIDQNEDGFIDNVLFILYGNPSGAAPSGPGSILWAHQWRLFTQSADINGKKVWMYEVELYNPGHIQTVIVYGIVHEMLHSMGVPDLYRADNMTNIYWPALEDIMSAGEGACSYIKYRYLHWIPDIPVISKTGTYALKPRNSPDNYAYRILSPFSATEYFILEYKRKIPPFEVNAHNEGLLIHRINTLCDGEGDNFGPPDEIYTYRPDGTLEDDGQNQQAAFSVLLERTAINDRTNPSSFLSNGAAGGLNIRNVGKPGDVITFEAVIPEADAGPGVTFTVTVPASTPAKDTLWIMGNFNAWDPGSGQTGLDGIEHSLPMQSIGNSRWRITLPFANGRALEYKYTRGDWKKVEKDATGGKTVNRTFTVPGADTGVNDVVAAWLDDATKVNGLFTVTVPPATPPSDSLWITGSFNDWDPGPGQPGMDGREHDLVMLPAGGNLWHISLPFTPGQMVEYKFTRGNWGKVETSWIGKVMANRTLAALDADFTVTDTVKEWADTKRVVPLTLNVLVTPTTPPGDSIWICGSTNFFDPGPGLPGMDGLEHDLPMSPVGGYRWQVTLPCSLGQVVYYQYTRGKYKGETKGPGGRNKYFTSRSLVVDDTVMAVNDKVGGWVDFSSDPVNVDFQVVSPYWTPAGDTVWIAGTFNCWDPGSGQAGIDSEENNYFMLRSGNNRWHLVVPLYTGQYIEYKYTLGGWPSQETGVAGGDAAKRSFFVTYSNMTVRDTIAAWSDPAAVEGETAAIPAVFRLYQNHPNPFNASTVIRYDLPAAEQVRLDIFNIRGERVKTLVDRREEAGSRQVILKADDLSSGIYFYRIAAGKNVATRKLLLIR